MGLYYLQARYYNPEMGRFINADGLISTGQGSIGNNMFAYCLNDPVNMEDPSGEFGFAIPLIFGLVEEIVKAVVITVTIVVGIIATSKLIKAENKKKETEGVTEAGAPNSKSWKAAKKKIKEGRGKGVNVKARNEKEAEQLIKEAKPKLEKRPTYEANPPKSGYEIHPVDNDYGMPHIKWRDWSNGKASGADGHIFWDN